MPRAIVLGAGMIGSVMAADLARDEDLEVTIADVRPDALAAAAARAGRTLETIEADLTNAESVRELVEPFDVVLGALSSSLGYRALEGVVAAGKPYADISFMTEDPARLDALARTRGATVVPDCGVAPGMTNMLAGRAAERLDPCERIAIFVGGLPRERRLPFQYKAAFAPLDVIEEYTRPVHLMEGGRVVVREALSEAELIDLPGIGTLEAVNTDGLRSLLETLGVPDMIEKTLRYPGHVDLMRVFRDTGLFGREPIVVGETRVRPLDVTGTLLFPLWTYGPGEEDLTVMRVIAEGKLSGESARMTWDLFDVYDRESGTTSMARTTAYPCTAVARLLARGKIHRKGVLPPERIAQQPGVLDEILRDLAARGVVYREKTEML